MPNEPDRREPVPVSAENFAIVREAMRQAVTLGHGEERRGARRAGRRQDRHRGVRPALRRRQLRDARLVQRLRARRRARRSPSRSSSSAASARRTPRRSRRASWTTTSTGNDSRADAARRPARGAAMNLRNTPTREFDFVLLLAAHRPRRRIGALLIYSGSLTHVRLARRSALASGHAPGRSSPSSASPRMVVDVAHRLPHPRAAQHHALPRRARRSRATCSSPAAASSARDAGSRSAAQQVQPSEIREGRDRRSCSRSISPTTRSRSAHCASSRRRSPSPLCRPRSCSSSRTSVRRSSSWCCGSAS